jgi:hypothetical protein
MIGVFSLSSSVHLRKFRDSRPRQIHPRISQYPAIRRYIVQTLKASQITQYIIYIYIQRKNTHWLKKEWGRRETTQAPAAGDGGGGGDDEEDWRTYNDRLYTGDLFRDHSVCLRDALLLLCEVIQDPVVPAS